MTLKHTDIWRAIDKLAELNGLSVSGLAIKAGLSSTSFNPSKRQTKNHKHWPNTESIAAILQATEATLDEFVALATSGAAVRRGLPLLAISQAAKAAFDEQGLPAGRGWDEMNFPRLQDPNAFALEVTGKSLQPVYREGDQLVVSPAEKPRKGDRVAVRTRKGDIQVRKLGHESAQKVELLAMNPEQPAFSISPREIEWMYRIVWVSQ